MAEPPIPKDKWNLLYLTLLFHGVGTLIAWNMLITAKDYFVKFKLDETVYAQNFLAYMGWASQIPNVLFNWFNVFARLGGRLSIRIICSITVMLGLFVITIVLAMIDTSRWPGMFFWLTMIIVFCLNGLNAIYQNSIFGVAARLPPKYMGGYILGNNVCGTLVVGLSFLSTFLHNLRTSAIYYFLGGIFILTLCLDSYMALPLNKFYRYLTSTIKAPPNAPGIQPVIPYRRIFWQTKAQLYNVYVTFLASLSVFPAVISDVTPVAEGFLGKHFMLITCFLTFNLTAMIGNITASLYRIPNKKFLIFFTTARLAFFPLFLLCNYQVPGRTLKVMFKNDWIFWLFAALHGWSSGHGSSLAMMYVGGEVAPEYATKAGMIGGAMLMSGIMSGVLITRLAPIIVSLSMWAEKHGFGGHTVYWRRLDYKFRS